MTEQKITFAAIQTALALGKVEMKTPWGTWVPVRRRSTNVKPGTGYEYIPVWMENDVEASISMTSAAFGYPDVRIVP